MKLFRDDVAVSDVVGTILLVSITVFSAGIFSLFLTTIEAPEPNVRADLEVRSSPGEGGWGTGDEQIWIRHMGGDSLGQDDTTVMLRIGTSILELTDLGEGFQDGQFTIGETWFTTLSLSESDTVFVRVVHSQTSSVLIFAGPADQAVQA